MNEGPAFGEDSPVVDVNENTSGGAALAPSFTAVDPDNVGYAGGSGNIVDMLTYSLQGVDAAIFTIDDSDGVISLAATTALNFEVKSSYTVVQKATDIAGNSAMLPIDVRVLDLNEAPVIAGATSASLDEGSVAALGTWTFSDVDAGDIGLWSLAGADAALFEVSATGVLRFIVAPDYEGTGDNNYAVILVITDSGRVTDEHSVSVTVLNIDEQGSVALSDSSPVVGTVVIATLTDPDGSISGRSWSWHRSPVGEPTNLTAIPGATSASYITETADIDHVLTVKVEYTDGEGGGKRAEVRTSDGTPNSAPAFDSTQTSRAIDENSSGGTSVGTAVTAMDDDAATGDTLTYSLSGAHAGAFVIDKDSGQISTASTTELDYETDSSYSVTVTAIDRNGESDSILVIISINDLNEAPAFDSDVWTFTISEDHTPGGAVGTMTAVDVGHRRSAVIQYFVN